MTMGERRVTTTIPIHIYNEIRDFIEAAQAEGVRVTMKQILRDAIITYLDAYTLEEMYLPEEWL